MFHRHLKLISFRASYCSKNASHFIRTMSATSNSTTSIAQQLQEILSQTFHPISHIEVINESSGHSVPKNSETHFRVIVVSDKFHQMLPIQRHRAVYSSVNSLMRPSDANPSSPDYFHRIHALAIVAKTPTEFERVTNKESLTQSPKCLGGEKKERQQRPQDAII